MKLLTLFGIQKAIMVLFRAHGSVSSVTTSGKLIIFREVRILFTLSDSLASPL